MQIRLPCDRNQLRRHGKIHLHRCGQESLALLSVFYSLQRYKITQPKTMKGTDPTESENRKGLPDTVSKPNSSHFPSIPAY